MELVTNRRENRKEVKEALFHPARHPMKSVLHAAATWIQHS
jgi:hypothetical protein